MFFGVIVPSKTYRGCKKTVSGVLADGERVATADDGKNKWFGMTLLSEQDEKYTGYLKLYERYRPEDFLKIVNATNVTYQLCGDPDKVFTLSPEEKEDLRQFANIVLPSNLVNQPPEDYTGEIRLEDFQLTR